jgi:hypothetical protein
MNASQRHVVSNYLPFNPHHSIHIKKYTEPANVTNELPMKKSNLDHPLANSILRDAELEDPDPELDPELEVGLDPELKVVDVVTLKETNC